MIFHLINLLVVTSLRLPIYGEEVLTLIDGNLKYSAIDRHLGKTYRGEILDSWTSNRRRALSKKTNLNYVNILARARWKRYLLSFRRDTHLSRRAKGFIFAHREKIKYFNLNWIVTCKQLLLSRIALYLGLTSKSRYIFLKCT